MEGWALGCEDEGLESLRSAPVRKAITVLGSYNATASCNVAPHAPPLTLHHWTKPWIRLMCRRALWRERTRQKIELATLNERSLRDIGLSRDDAQQMQTMLFWR
jgi:uncharacterized protein YjiS (DUF1127 family)